MKLYVDTKSVSSENNNLRNYIKDYSDNCRDMFFELSKLSSYWKDDSSSLFLDKIKAEEMNCLLITEVLEKINELYKNVENIYERY